MTEYLITFAMGISFGYLAHLFLSAHEFIREWRKIRDEWRKVRLAKREKIDLAISHFGSSPNAGWNGFEIKIIGLPGKADSSTVAMEVPGEEEVFYA